MGKFQNLVNESMKQSGDAYLRITCSAAGDWVDQEGKSVGTTPTSGIYRMRPGDHCVHAISAAADTVAIVVLPNVVEAAGQHYYIAAPTGAAGGDISLYEAETNTELTTNGDMDADADHLILFSTGIAWLTRLDGVA